MSLSKREQARQERQLVAALTEACDAALASIVGFVWLTHQWLPEGLQVTWVFDTEAHKAHALEQGLAGHMLQLTADALKDAGSELVPTLRNLRLDSEEALRRRGKD